MNHKVIFKTFAVLLCKDALGLAGNDAVMLPLGPGLSGTLVLVAQRGLGPTRITQGLAGAVGTALPVALSLLLCPGMGTHPGPCPTTARPRDTSNKQLSHCQNKPQ